MDEAEIEEKLWKALLGELGYKEFAERFKFLANPEIIKTMSRLNLLQCEMIADCYLAKTFYDEFGPIWEFAEEVALSMISHKGSGREEIIKFEQASKRAQEGGAQIGIFSTPSSEGEKKKRFWQRSKKESE